MSLGASVQIVVDGIADACEQRDWTAIQRLGERVRMIILDAVADRNRSGLSEVAATLEVAEAVLPVEGGDPSLVRVAWMLRMDASLAKLAARRIPAQGTSTGEADRSARDRILQALSGANAAPSVASVAKMSGLARETVSRLLPVMAGEGLVRFRKVGRKTLSRITLKGRAAMGERPLDVATSIRNVHGVQVEVVMMTSSSLAHRRAHRMVGARAKREVPVDRDMEAHWFDTFASAHEGVVGLRSGLPAPKDDVLQMIINDSPRTVRDRVMEIPA